MAYDISIPAPIVPELEEPRAVAPSSASRQKLWAVVVTGVFALVSVATYAYNEYYMYLSAYLWFGFVYGMCLQYGRFCFASAFRDLFAIGVPRMVVGIMIATVFFALVSSLVSATGFSTFHPSPSGAHSVVAGTIFGVGMVVAGGCASGSLYKAGEGKVAAMIVILSISVTQSSLADVGGPLNALVPASWHASATSKGLPEVLAAGDGWLDQYLAGYVWNHPTLTFAQVLGLENASLAGALGGNFLVGVVLPAVAVLAIAYVVWARKGHVKELAKRGGAPGLRGELAGFWRMVMSSRRTAIAGLVLGVACGLQMFVIEGLRIKFGIRNAGELLTRLGSDYGLSVRGTVFDPGYWYVTTQEAQWVGWVAQKLGWNNMDNIFFGYVNGIPNPALNPADWMSIALIGGAAVMALLHGEFKLKTPTLGQAGWAVLGGVLMGVGSRLGLGCNVGAFFVRAANGDVGGWLFGVGMIAGAYLGVRFFGWWTERQMRRELAALDL
ncbi:MAG TPA: YeeE/YedE family protein [Anaeromyxobacter sp.]|nr:YeeE/YedE family protein [Anaeromyxobacter sp.]